jgi:hypothetical protein
MNALHNNVATYLIGSAHGSNTTTRQILAVDLQ